MDNQQELKAITVEKEINIKASFFFCTGLKMLFHRNNIGTAQKWGQCCIP